MFENYPVTFSHTYPVTGCKDQNSTVTVYIASSVVYKCRQQAEDHLI